jgi:plastocyanin
MPSPSRRGFLATASSLAVGAVAGCLGGDVPDGDVEVGPGASQVFKPREYAVSVGDTVTWTFASAGHNVSAVPDHGDPVSLPDGAEPFASYPLDDDDARFRTDPRGDTFEHTFETPGEYTYVCVPHIRSRMIGTIVVEE